MVPLERIVVEIGKGRNYSCWWYIFNMTVGFPNRRLFAAACVQVKASYLS